MVFANDLVNGANERALTITRQLQTLSTSITSLSLKLNETWPCITLPHFLTRTQELATLSGAELIVFAPIVRIPSQVAEWNLKFNEGMSDILTDTVRSCKSAGWTKQSMSIGCSRRRRRQITEPWNLQQTLKLSLSLVLLGPFFVFCSLEPTLPLFLRLTTRLFLPRFNPFHPNPMSTKT